MLRNLKTVDTTSLEDTFNLQNKRHACLKYVTCNVKEFEMVDTTSLGDTFNPQNKRHGCLKDVTSGHERNLNVDVFVRDVCEKADRHVIDHDN